MGNTTLEEIKLNDFIIAKVKDYSQNALIVEPVTKSSIGEFFSMTRKWKAFLDEGEGDQIFGKDQSSGRLSSGI